MVHSCHLSWVWHRLDLYCLRSRPARSMRCTVSPGHFRSWDAPGNRLLPFSLVPTRRASLPFLSLYIVAAPLAGAFGGLLASAILTLDHFGSLHTWRMIFAIEGIITCGLSLISFLTLTDRPETARWLSPAEKDLAIARVKSERVSLKGIRLLYDLTSAVP